MKMQYLILVTLGVAAVLVGSVCSAYQLYKLVGIDAESRGLKHPKLWGAFSLSGNGSSGLLLYLIGRRKYPVLQLTRAQEGEKGRRKKKLAVSLAFQAVGAILAVASMLLAQGG